MKKVREVIFNATVYRSLSVALQLIMVSIIFGLATKWKVVLACNLLCFAWYIVYHLSAIRVRRYFKHLVKMPTIKVYMSHPIRGSKVDDATKTEQLSNSGRARLAAVEIRKAFPDLDIYCPGDAEKFVYLTYAGGLLTDAQILDIDCKILGECDCIFAYDFDTSRGVQIEKDYAVKHQIPLLSFESLNSEAFNRIRVFIDELVRLKDIRE